MTGFGWNSALEILIFWIGIYLILRSLRGTRGLGILKGGIGVILGLYLASKILELQSGISLAVLNFAIEKTVTVALIGFVIIFQPELRRGLTRLGQKPFSWLSGRGPGQSVSPIVVAAGRMSRRRIGALVVIERNVGISHIKEDAVPLSAEVTAELLETIFYPNGPLHDGAAVVLNNRLVAARCYLPLSDSPNLSPEMGTRHRAAVGLTEETDALVVVVSEQTGRISLCFEGVIYSMRDSRDLEVAINHVLESGELPESTRERTRDLRESRAESKSSATQKNGEQQDGEAAARKPTDRAGVSVKPEQQVRIEPPQQRGRGGQVRREPSPSKSPQTDEETIASESPETPGGSGASGTSGAEE